MYSILYMVMQMEQKERIIKILDLLDEKESLELADLVAYFGVSKDTARRDILKLVEQGLADRRRGGIALPRMQQKIENYSERLIKNSQEKQRIAQQASHFIQDNQTVWLDVSTTVQLMEEHMTARNTMLVTNSLDNALAFSKHTEKIYVLGGFYHHGANILNGVATIAQIHQFQFDVAFIGASGVDEQGIYYDSIDDIPLHQAIIQNAKTVYVLADQTKFHQTTNFKISWNGITGLITQTPIPEKIVKQLEKQEIECIIGGIKK